jgi:hypothetical protein
MRSPVLCLLSVALLGPALAAQSASPEPRTQIAVIAVDDGWEEAELSGNTAYVDALLLPEYRSISADGSIHDKAAILDSTRKASAERAAKINAWMTQHPMRKSVTMEGDTAILTFTLDKGDATKPVMSSDIFVYRDGRWRALYSQHTTAGS